MVGVLLVEPLVVRQARVVLRHPLLREGTVLDLPQDLDHLLLGLRVDQPRAARVSAVLGGLGDRPVHLRQSALIHQVDDQLHLVKALEVGDLGLVARIHEGLEAGLDELGQPAAQHRLLAEQVGLGLLGEGRLDRARARAADALRIGLHQVPGGAGRVLLDREEHGDAATVDELAAYEVAGALGGDHAHVDAGRRLDQVIADVEPVPEEHCVAVDQVGLDGLGIELALHGVGGEHHDEVRLLARLERRDHAQPLRVGLLAALRPLGQADAHVDA